MAESSEIVDLLASLGRAVDAAAVVLQLSFDREGPVEGDVDASFAWSPYPDEGDEQGRSELIGRAHQEWSASADSRHGAPVLTFDHNGFHVAVTGLYGAALEDRLLIVVRQSSFERGHVETIGAFGRLVPVAMERADIGSPLEDLVSHVATELMSVRAVNVEPALQRVVRTLAEFFQVSTAFLRRNDHQDGASYLVAEWPVREQIPDPDPIARVPFDGPDTDPVFSAIRDLREPLVIRPHEVGEYQERINRAAGIPNVALATVPILREGVTSGVLGFVNFGDRSWSKSELNALRAIASLLAQLEGRVEAEQQLQRRAYRDELTGLPNRRSLREELASRLREAPTEPLAVVFADVDRLKALNDNLGHAAGDVLLRTIGERLERHCGPRDLVARIGGDEFVIVLNAPDDPLSATEELMQAVSRTPIRVRAGTIRVTMCAGVAIGRAGSSVDDLLHQADVALIEAKSHGQDTVLAFDDDMSASSEMRADITRELHRAVGEARLALHYMPEVDLRSGELIGFEALLRWNHRTRGMMRPEAFIQFAEDSPPLMCEIGEWVLGEACRQLAAWREQSDAKFVMRVNVSAVQLVDSGFVTMVERTLESHGLSGQDLCLELTEGALLSEVGNAPMILRSLRERGISVALDDFGTGYSTLRQLRRLPIDLLKIDRQFVAGLGTDVGDDAIVEWTIVLARSFGIGVVAEGVESVTAAQALVRLGCYQAEGHLIAEAAPPERFVEAVRAGRFELCT